MAEIPKKRLNVEELNELRKQNAFKVRPPIQAIKNLALHPFFLGLSYALCLLTMGLVIGEIYLPGLICAGITMLGSLLIFWRKPRSRHHAALMAVISLLVLVFGFVYYFAQLEQTTYDPQGPTRY